MSRLSSVVIDVEQEVIPTLVVSHVSILQCLMAYFRNTRVEKCMSIEVPLHTVIKFTPVRGGGWSESHHHFYDRFGGGDDAPQDNDDSLVQTSTMRHSIESISEFSQLDSSLNSFSSSFPIWGDSMAMMRNSPCAVKK